VVNLASRICSGAKDGQVIIDPGTAAALTGAIDLEDLGTRPMKGFAEAVPVFAVKQAAAIEAKADVEDAALNN
jgi:class 3 adenylate cyclase